MESLTVQLCTAEDAPRLVPLVRALAREEGTEPATHDHVMATIVHLIQTSSSDFLLAVLDDEPVGCTQIAWRHSTWNAAPYAYLEDVYVVPALRGRGIGRRMLHEAMRQIDARGADLMMLDVRTDNQAAQRLYEHLGFKNSGSMLMKRAASTHDVAEDRQHLADVKDTPV